MDYTLEQCCSMWLYGLPGVGVQAYHQLVGHYGSAQAAYQARQEWGRTGLPLRAEAVQAALQPADLQAIPQRLAKRQAYAVFAGQADYPATLTAPAQPPPLLYVRGQAHVLQSDHALAMVGSRHGTRYGTQAAGMLAQAVAAQGGLIVSGGARGVDTAAHCGALAAGRPTVAVLGCGIDQDYPPENAELFEQIAAQGGAVVTEFAPGMPSRRENFPLRNRLIAGLSRAVLLVEAQQKSGAMITARYAVSQGKPLYALPGPITSAFSAGPHLLLRQGAFPVFEAADLIAAVGLTAPNGPAEEPSGRQMPLRELTAEENAVLACLRRGDAGHELLLQETGLDNRRLNTVLTGLVLDGLIRQLPGNRYGV